MQVHGSVYIPFAQNTVWNAMPSSVRPQNLGTPKEDIKLWVIIAKEVIRSCNSGVKIPANAGVAINAIVVLVV
jgi:hypothetical protein